jgi:CheY-like chemotaxis protein
MNRDGSGAVRGRVLVVDDEPLVGRAVARVLAAVHDVVVATSANEALAKLTAGEPFDVVLCDLMMPGMTGVDLHRTVAAVAADLAARFIFLTGGAFSPEAQEYVDRSGADRIGKPFDAAELRALVSAHVQRRRAAAA